ncbi:hypothetical protein HZF05_21565 [Sphingomonas sp. CGMCC 1.13654]|uniref:Uncharacterized protein n=1 Tax=Sphingomonas chungangi TaxID=2683589 RepID=A0A838LEX4_9SPHN|nr:hypothetical protein [Sphingomonas chungangi]MBA2936676.1 hypothetical protein [Sphingomonas chungangi]MVW56061.1 hypothetical protein [Sphingomonas chungangi]
MTTIDARAHNRPSNDGCNVTQDPRQASLMDTVSEPDPESDPAEQIEEKGEPFDGNHA